MSRKLESNMWEDNKKLYLLLYGIDVNSEKDLKKRLSEIKEEKISLIELIVDKMSEVKGKTRDEFLNKDIKAVEIGPGEGIMAKWLSKYVDHVYCFDVSENMLDACKNYISKNKNISTHLIGYNTEHFKQISDYLEKDSIDMVYSQSVFIHLSPYDFYIYFKDLYPLLKTNALLWIDIIDSDVEKFTFNEKELQKQMDSYKQFFDFGQYENLKTMYYINSKSALEKIGKELGYHLVWSESSIYNPTNVSLIFKKI
jgi:ubiquinone/menaquinone biosynthesis C-methylase UbiE